MASPIPVIDTADWTLIVPLANPLKLAGSRLMASMTAQWGGPPAVSLDSDAGAISWVADTEGLSAAITIIARKGARGDWLAIGADGQAGKVTLYFDVHRIVTGSPADEWLGRTAVTVYPGTDSPAITARTPNGRAVIGPIQPTCPTILPALQTGPQGPAGGDGGGSMPKQTVYQITAAASFIASHSFSYRPATLLLLPSGEEVETDTAFADGQVSLTFAAPFTGTLYLG